MLRYSIRKKLISEFLYNASIGCKTIEDSVSYIERHTPPYESHEFIEQIDEIAITLKTGRTFKMKRL